MKWIFVVSKENCRGVVCVLSNCTLLGHWVRVRKLSREHSCVCNFFTYSRDVKQLGIRIASLLNEKRTKCSF